MSSSLQLQATAVSAQHQSLPQATVLHQATDYGTNTTRRSPNLESRPVPQQDIKKFSLLKRLFGLKHLHQSNHNHNNHYHNHHQHRNHRTSTSHIHPISSSQNNRNNNNNIINTNQSNNRSSNSSTTTTVDINSNAESNRNDNMRIDSPTATNCSLLSDTTAGKMPAAAASLALPSSSKSNNGDDTNNKHEKKILLEQHRDDDSCDDDHRQELIMKSQAPVVVEPTSPVTTLLPTTPVPSLMTIVSTTPTTKDNKTKTATAADYNIMEWMESDDCPNDVLPLVLAFAGPQKASSIGKTNKFWNHLLDQESTWRRLCEEMYKWKDGDEIPDSWKKYYVYNPCVPVDYSTIHRAIDGAIEKATKMEEEEKKKDGADIRILLQPGRRYVLRQAITIDENVDSVISSIAIETMEYYPEIFVDENAVDYYNAEYRSYLARARSGGRHHHSTLSSHNRRGGIASSSSSSMPKTKRLTLTIRKLLQGCRSSSAVDIDATSSENNSNNDDDDDIEEDEADEDDDAADDIIMDAAAAAAAVDDARDDREQQQQEQLLNRDENTIVPTDLGGDNDDENRIAALNEHDEDTATSTATTFPPSLPPPPKRPAPQAMLVLRTRKKNEPLIRIRQGSCTVRNIKLKHISKGTDIWNGNAGIQIQPPIIPNATAAAAAAAPAVPPPPAGIIDDVDDNDNSNNNGDNNNNNDDRNDGNSLAAVDRRNSDNNFVNMPNVTLDRVDVTSSSGRGIVNIDGGNLTILNSYVHECAATGIYVGGPGSRATIRRSDVLKNGLGNTVHPHRRAIPRGHSGIYLEQGRADIIDCNVSQNSLTGISAISSDNATLNLVNSDLVSNGTFQLEMPAIGTPAHRNSNVSARSNHFAAEGMLSRSRSGLIVL